MKKQTKLTPPRVNGTTEYRTPYYQYINLTPTDETITNHNEYDKRAFCDFTSELLTAQKKRDNLYNVGKNQKMVDIYARPDGTVVSRFTDANGNTLTYEDGKLLFYTTLDGIDIFITDGYTINDKGNAIVVINDGDLFLDGERVRGDMRGQILDNSNIERVSKSIAIRALMTVVQKSGDLYIYKQYLSACAYANNPFTNDGQNGGDFINDTVLYLCKYRGKTLDAPNTDGYTDKDGNPVPVIISAFRHIHKNIYNAKKRAYKHIYIEDYERDNAPLQIPFEYDITDFNTYVNINKLINGLDLNDAQKTLINMRLRGKSIEYIARYRGTTRQAVQNALKKIQARYCKIYPSSALAYGVMSADIYAQIMSNKFVTAEYLKKE